MKDFIAKSLNSKNSNQGNVGVFFIIALVVIFAIMLSGGSGSLTSGNIASGITPLPTSENSTLQPLPTTASPSASTQWTINYTNDGCIDETTKFSKGILEISGDTDGTLAIQVQNGESFMTIITSPFTSPSKKYALTLSNTDGFNSNPWRITLNSNQNVREILNINPTGC